VSPRFAAVVVAAPSEAGSDAAAARTVEHATGETATLRVEDLAARLG
jgi:hypothetical protein